MELHDPARSPAKDECRRQIIFQAYLSTKGKQKKPAKPTAMRVYGCGGSRHSLPEILFGYCVTIVR